ncbi:GAF domain-containing protein [Bradyrhizobium sp. USDA 4471]
MANLKEPLDAATGQQIDAVLQRLRNSNDVRADLLQILDIAIGTTGADMGTLQRFDESADCLTIIASCGLSTEALMFFGVVRRDMNTTCAAALMRRMRVFVGDVSTSYLFVGTRELDVLRAAGIVAAQSTPLISSNGHLWGVFTTHFREPQRESEFDPAPLDRLAVQVADSLEQREGLVPSQNFHGKQVPEDSQPGG